MSSKNWMPSREHDFVDLCNRWVSVLRAEGNVAKFKWDEAVCLAVYQNLEGYLTARTDYQADNSTAKRIIRDTSRKTATGDMRMFANMFIRYNPSVDEVTRAALGIITRDTTSTPVGDPAGMATAEIIYTGPMQLTLRIKHVAGTSTDIRANYGCRIYFGMYAPGEISPATGKDLRESIFTRLKRELFKFEPDDRGKVAWFCIRYENSRGRAGQWGPMISAIIP